MFVLVPVCFTNAPSDGTILVAEQNGGADMKLVPYDDVSPGILREDSVIDASGAIDGVHYTSRQDLMNRLIETSSRDEARRSRSRATLENI